MINNKPRFKEGDIVYFKDSEYLKFFNDNKSIDETVYKKYRNTELKIRRVNRHKDIDNDNDYPPGDYLYYYGISPNENLLLFDTITAIDYENSQYAFNMSMFETKQERRKRIIKEVLC